MVKKVIVPENENHVLTIPKEFLNKKVEIILKLHKSKDKKTKDKIKKLFQKKKVKVFEEIEDPLKWQKKLRDEWN